MVARVVPGRRELERMLDSGMTHREIAEAVTRQTGHLVRRSTISSAIHREGLSGPAKKYEAEIPWKVKSEHLTHYAARMLRLLGRRRAGVQNSAEMDARLNAWLELLEDNHAVVTYLPETRDGFFYIDGEPNEDGIPIRESVKL